MPSERVQRQIDRLLDEAEQALIARDWEQVRVRAEDVLRLDPDNDDARSFAAAASRSPTAQASSAGPAETFAHPQAFALPDSLGNGRYEVKKLLGEGGKKRVYLCHDAKQSALAVGRCYT